MKYRCTDDFEHVIKTANDESCTSIPDELIMLLPNVIRELKSIGKLDIFVKFMKLVNEKRFSFKNIAFLLWCDIINWFDNTDTRQMRYSPECLQFFWVGRKLFGAVLLGSCQG